ncbi:MAG: hypothetical protein JNM27_13910 [Leptospirales bacterium]|nr:hypothetical protein [Leptospirales bacterium]
MADADEVVKAAGSLRDMLSELDKENKKLSTDLAKKRKERTIRVKEARALQKKLAGQMDKLEAQIQKGKTAMEKQSQTMVDVKRSIKQQESMLRELAGRIERLETGLRGGKLSIPDARRELLKMLEDLQKMKKQREKILARTGMVNADNFPTFRVDP